ncbi:hypothetical protein [Paenibacillus sp. Pae108]|uniref:hypothetical protein n=1 Tax=Paenibacillus sp. Pae108 TaxID=2926019 RepID=UPI0006D2AB6C|nr:hypothetical protein [Paenibacillus sp. Pae108]
MVLANSFSHDILWDIKKKGGLVLNRTADLSRSQSAGFAIFRLGKQQGRTAFPRRRPARFFGTITRWQTGVCLPGRSRHASFAGTAAACFLLDERELLT